MPFEISQYNSLSLQKMQYIAGIIAHRLNSGDIITLSGEIGSGKTTFAKALIESILVQPAEVTSPTFTLMQSYDVNSGNGVADTLWHLDLYRLKICEEAEELGLRDLWQHITVIEWPEIIERLLPKERLDISFDFGNNQDTRTLRFSGDETWKERLRGIQ